MLRRVPAERAFFQLATLRPTASFDGKTPAGLLFSLAVVTQITWIVRLPKILRTMPLLSRHFSRIYPDSAIEYLKRKRFAFEDGAQITIIQFDAFLSHRD